MDTTKLTHRTGHATAILVGSIIALTPIAADASEVGVRAAVEPAAHCATVTGGHDLRARLVVRFQVPTGPDIALSARLLLPRAIESGRGSVADSGTAPPTLRQLMEADRALDVRRAADAPTLRQRMEADR